MIVPSFFTGPHKVCCGEGSVPMTAQFLACSLLPHKHRASPALIIQKNVSGSCSTKTTHDLSIKVPTGALGRASSPDSSPTSLGTLPKGIPQKVRFSQTFLAHTSAIMVTWNWYERRRGNGFPRTGFGTDLWSYLRAYAVLSSQPMKNKRPVLRTACDY